MAADARILVVDDDPGVVRAVSRVLGRQHEVRPEVTGAAALEALGSFDPDIAILDVRMPEMNGFELMRRLRERRPDVDVIIMTGSMAEPETHLIRAIDEGAFYFIQKPFDRRVLQTLVARCLDLRELRQEKQRQMQRLERELAAARQFQRSLLPPASGRIDSAAISARLVACTELGGDMYDYVPAGPGCAAVLVADVSGHGAPAAMMTGIVKSAFRAARVDDFAPRGVVGRVVESMRAFEPSRFVTLFAARLDSTTGVLDYVGAGHPPPLVQAPGAPPRPLEPTGPLISSGFLDLPWETARVDFGPGERLLLYTDGITEAPGESGMYGGQRLAEALGRDGTRGEGLLDFLLAEVAAFTGDRPPRDDMTLMAVELDPAAA